VRRAYAVIGVIVLVSVLVLIRTSPQELDYRVDDGDHQASGITVLQLLPSSDRSVPCGSSGP
jgi:hypothetical protein